MKKISESIRGEEHSVFQNIFQKGKSAVSSLGGVVKDVVTGFHERKPREVLPEELKTEESSPQMIDGIDNVHSDVVDDHSKVVKEMWLGRDLYGHLLDGSFFSLALQDADKADTYILEWEGCLFTHKEIFPVLQSVFTKLQFVFDTNASLQLLRTWMFLLEQLGLERIGDKVITIQSDNDMRMFANALSITRGMPANAEYKIKKASWILHNDQDALVIKRGELEVMNVSNV